MITFSARSMSLVRILAIAWLALLWAVGSLMAGETPWTEIPSAQWKGATAAEVPALKRTAAAAIALPTKEAKLLTATTVAVQPPGLYEIRLTLRPSHVADAVAFNAGLRVKLGDQSVAVLPGQFFARVHQPETRVLQAVQAKAGPLALGLEAFAGAKVVENNGTARLKLGRPEVGVLDAAVDLELELTLTPARAVYYLVDKIEFRPLSRTGRVVRVEIDKIRYLPGATLKGSAVVADVGGQGGSGTLNLYLEHNVKDRVKARSLPVTLKPEPQGLAFEIPLPKEELGYALVAEYVSTDGADCSEVAEYFTIAANFQRVALIGATRAARAMSHWRRNRSARP